MLINAKQRNPDMIFELFSNSPPWWMTRNKYTSGGQSSEPHNLQVEDEENFAIYLATVAKYYHHAWWRMDRMLVDHSGYIAGGVLHEHRAAGQCD